MAFKIMKNEPAVVDPGDLALFQQGTQICTKDPAGVVTCYAGAAPLPSMYEAYQIGVTLLVPTYTLIPMTTEESAQAGYSIAGGVITVTNAGRYKVSISMSADGTNASRASSKLALFHNGIEITRSACYSYHRTVASGEGTASKTLIVNIAASDTLEIRALIFGDSVTTITGTSNIVLEKI